MIWIHFNVAGRNVFKTNTNYKYDFKWFLEWKQIIYPSLKGNMLEYNMRQSGSLFHYWLTEQACSIHKFRVGTNGSEVSVGTGEGLVAGDGLLAEKREPSLSDDGRLTWDWTLHCFDRISSADSAVITSAVFANVETPLCKLDEDPGELAVRLFNMSGWNSGCRRACLLRWSLLINRLSQIGHTNFFSPENA